MKKLRFLPILLLTLVFACQQKEPLPDTLPMQVAKAYGFENFEDLKSIGYTWNVQRDSVTIASRTWKWNIQDSTVSFADADTSFTYSLTADSLPEKDGAFINDKYWAIPGYSLYSSTKAAILQWADCLWSEGDGDWLTLVFPIATATAFFDAAGPNIPRAFPIQRPQEVAKSMLTGAAKGKNKIFPSTLFKSILFLNRLLFVLQPLAQALEFQKFKNWVSSKNSH